MATTVASPKGRLTAGRIIFRIVAGFLVLGMLAVVGAAVWFYRASHSPLAQLDGTISLAGLSAPVSVVRDQHGVPHLTASNLDDLFFAQGYVTAQDRLWQMDMTRRSVAGEMAEVLPAASAPAAPPSRSTAAPRTSRSWVDYDKQQRILRLRAVADRVTAQLPARDREFFEAYARGVNAYIDRHQKNLPIEFRILNYAPRRWTASDSVLVGIGMSQLLNPQFEMEFWREKIGQHLSPDLMADLYPPSSWRDRPPGSLANDGATAPGSVPYFIPRPPKADTRKTKSAAGITLLAGAGWNDCEACLPGSNNWVISGQHTTTGKPLLSNDMHLPHRVPGVWYEVQLHSGDYDVEGFSLPGMPMVTVGHNQRMAWGYTNLNPGVQDLFVENFNAAGEYETPKGWQKPEMFHEVIRVKGRPDVALDVEVTRHGPIITSLLPGETRKIALGWLIYDTRSISIPLYELNTAQNWEQFRKALSLFATPSQNVVYADVDGNIGYQAMGFVPVRGSGDGTVPVSGADGKHDWTGYLPFYQLPSVFNPPSGIIATANAKITPAGYPYLMATQWFPPYRTERIYKMLEGEPNKKFSPADMLALQTDITSEYDLFFAASFADAIDHSSHAGKRAREAAGILHNFDGRMSADSAAPTIEVRSRVALWKLLLEPKLGPEWIRYEWSESAVALENIVRDRPRRWLPPGYSTFNDLLTAAVEKALEDAPADLNSWRYGTTYPVVINHPLFSAVPGLRSWAGPGTMPQSGGSYTVKQVGRTFGPSERMTVDFSNLDDSTFNIVLGESGQIFSTYYMDQWDAWYNNRTFTLAFSDAAIQGAKSHELRLEPSSK
ncbi:MAG TPA: penicillin acylase family protein [Candidatus Angelobacter sp.]|nr:penicillin acylase family protein [Candidatus Angelobacter sp.]